MDWAGWWRAWEQVMRGYLPRRQGCLATLTAAVGQMAGEQPKVLDLGARTGALAASVLDQLPDARCTPSTSTR